MSLAHTLEKSDIPILYNTPRLCDPGVSISKNWSLRNYIETRLYLFKFKYNFKNIQLTRNAYNCYPSILFDFRPFQYRLALPGAEEGIFVTEYITVDSTSGAEGYTPHMSFSKNGTTFPPGNKPQSSTVIFDAMVKKLISTKLGNSNTSIINQKLNLGPNNGNVNQSFLNNFRKFIEDYDGAKFDPPIILNRNKNNVPRIKLTDDVIRVLFYDLYHDKVVSKNDFADFKSQFKYQFYKSKNFDTSSFAGAKSTGKAYKAYGDIFFIGNRKQQKNSEGKNIKQIPAICKTLGDLSQFIYAAHYDTVVASGDKMGIATGLYINAIMNKPVKCMMEDVITGFIIYSGLPEIKFIRKTTCVSSTNGGACRLNGKTNKKDIQNRILRSVPSNKINDIKTIMNSKPKGIKMLLTLTINSAKSQNINSVTATINTLKKSYTYLNDTNLKKIITILNVYSKKNNIPQNTKINIAAFKGQIQAQIEKNNTGNAIRSNKKVTTGTSRVNRIRPFIMKMSHLTNNQKAYYINQAKTNNTKLLSEIVKNARLRAYRRT